MNTPRKQAVTDTSRVAYQAYERTTQREAVEAFIWERTRAGKPTWISLIADNAHRLGHPGLVKNAGARLNEIKKAGATIAGDEYVLVKLKDKVLPPIRNIHVEAWTFVLKSSQPEPDQEPTSGKGKDTYYDIMGNLPQARIADFGNGVILAAYPANAVTEAIKAALK